MPARGKKPTRAQGLRARDTHRRRLQVLPNVVGTMIGRKYIDGVAQKDVSVVVLVSTKKARSRLRAGDSVPKLLQIGDHRIRTDVLQISRARPQGWTRPILCTDTYKRGLVSLFWKTPNALYGMTCAHVVLGGDGDRDSPADVSLRNPALEKLRVGRTGEAYRDNGHGDDFDFGFNDASLFSVEPAWARQAVGELESLDIADAALEAKLTAVTGHDVLEGVVRGVRKIRNRRYCDYVIEVTYPGTFVGDSGMLWRNRSGAGVAIHARGSDDFANAGSKYSESMSLRRLVWKFDMDARQLRSPP